MTELPKRNSSVAGMSRNIKTGTLFYVLIGLAYLLYAGLLTVLALNQGGGFPIGVWPIVGAMYLLTCVVLFRMHIEVTDDSVLYNPGLGFRKTVRFDQIAYSRANGIALRVFVPGRRSAVMAIRLQPFPRGEVKWLLGLPQLKVTDASGRLGR